MTSHVVYDPKKRKLSSWESGIAGAASGFTTRLLTQPFDVVKIRLQLQVEATLGRNKGLYHGIIQSLYIIFKQEGFKSLWKGHVSCQLLTVSYASTQFYAYTFCSKLCHERGFTTSSQQSLSGAVGGATGTLVSIPFDVARTRIIAQSKSQYSGILDVWKQMVVNDGFFSLWRGLTPTLFMVVPSAAIQFRTYGYLVEKLTKGVPHSDEFIGIWISAVSGCLAGAISKLSVYPFDVLKKRIQILGSEHIRNLFGKVDTYKDPIHCALTICRNEGLPGWYKGVTPALLKSAISSSLIFLFYEIYCQFFRIKYPKR